MKVRINKGQGLNRAEKREQREVKRRCKSKLEGTLEFLSYQLK